jgi:protein disulfide-isomerase A1
MRVSLLSSLFLAAATSVFAADDSDVIDLTASNFESIVNPKDLILVEFFAPWYAPFHIFLHSRVLFMCTMAHS